MTTTAVVGVGGTLGALVTERLGARPVDLRCSDPCSERLVPELRDADVVVNVGGPRVRKGLGWGDYFREHVGVTASVVRSMRAGSHLVHVSSTAVYGARSQLLGATSQEAPTLFPFPAYACAKLAAEATARSLGTEQGIRVTVLRPSMVYGPGVDSAVATLGGLHRQGVRLRLVPAAVRQHLLHISVLMKVIERAAAAAPHLGSRSLIVADPFVLTNSDLAPARARRPVLTMNVGFAAKAHDAVLRGLGVSPGALGALAVLGIDNAFEVDPTWSALGIDPQDFDRRATFDSYWSEWHK